jgi:hypothetical protein
MGTYYVVHCHTCRKTFVPKLLKLREILVNLQIAASVGWFVCHHAKPECLIEIVGDNSKSRFFGGRRIAGYERVSAEQLIELDKDIQSSLAAGE